MKANELRIGNWITDRNKLVEVESYHFKLLDGYYNEDFNPIQLTEEWLLKFGFSDITVLCAHKIRNQKEFCLSFFVDECNEQQNLFITLGSRGWTFKRVGSPLYKYVHQLQNLYFALTGEELTIQP